MKLKNILLILVISVLWLACEKKLSITDFEDDFGYYTPELKIEGLLKQNDPLNSIVRIIKSSSITDPTVFNGQDDNHDGEIDDYDEVLPLIQDTTATVVVTNLDTGEEFNFIYVADADSFLNRERLEDDRFEFEFNIVHYGGYKPESSDFHLDTLNNYQIRVDSEEFNQIIIGETTIYPAVNFIDTLYNFEEDVVYMNIDDNKEIFWKSNLNVTSYQVVYEEMTMDEENEWDSEFLFTHISYRDNDLTDIYNDYSVGRLLLWNFDDEMVLKITIQALSPDLGQYISSSLPMNDPQRSNLRDESGKPVMGYFGAASSKVLYVVIQE